MGSIGGSVGGNISPLKNSYGLQSGNNNNNNNNTNNNSNNYCNINNNNNSNENLMNNNNNSESSSSTNNQNNSYIPTLSPILSDSSSLSVSSTSSTSLSTNSSPSTNNTNQNYFNISNINNSSNNYLNNNNSADVLCLLNVFLKKMKTFKVSNTSTNNQSSSTSTSNCMDAGISDFIFYGIGLSGLVNIFMARVFFNPKDDFLQNDSIYNIASALEFMIVSFSLNLSPCICTPAQQHSLGDGSGVKNQSITTTTSTITGNTNPTTGVVTTTGVTHRKRSTTLQQQQYQQQLLLLQLQQQQLEQQQGFLVFRINYEPLNQLILTSFQPGEEVSPLHFQIPILMVLYFLQLSLLLLSYNEKRSYRFLGLIISTVFIQMSSLESFSLNSRFFEAFPLEKLLIRRWIRCFVLIPPIIGIFLDIYQGWIGIFHRIKEQDQQKENLIIKNQQLFNRLDSQKQKLQSNNLFLKNTISQFKKIVHGTGSYLSLLNDSDVQPNQVAYLQKFSKAYEHLNLLAKESLLFSELRCLKKSDREKSLLEEVISIPSIRSYFEEKDIDLFYLIDHNVPLHVIGDSQKIKSILLKLLINALKATYQGEVFIKVSLQQQSTQQQQHQQSSSSTELQTQDEVILSFMVIDTGSGIESDYSVNLFEPYALSNYNLEGDLGLGLPICRQLAYILGGDISFITESSKGSTFNLMVPLKTQSSTQPMLFSKPILPTKWGNGLKVLVIDDNPNIGYVIEMHLEPLGFTVVKATSLSSGLNIFKETRDFSLIFLDSTIPFINIEDIKQIKNDPVNIKNPPLILMCSGKQRKSINIQGVHFLYKPIKKEQLLLITQTLSTTVVGANSGYPSSQLIMSTPLVSSSFSLQATPLFMNSNPPQSMNQSTMPSTPVSATIKQSKGRYESFTPPTTSGLSTSSPSSSNYSSPSTNNINFRYTSFIPSNQKISNLIPQPSGLFQSPTQTPPTAISPTASPLLHSTSHHHHNNNNNHNSDENLESSSSLNEKELQQDKVSLSGDSVDSKSMTSSNELNQSSGGTTTNETKGLSTSSSPSTTSTINLHHHQQQPDAANISPNIDSSSIIVFEEPPNSNTTSNNSNASNLEGMEQLSISGGNTFLTTSSTTNLLPLTHSPGSTSTISKMTPPPIGETTTTRSGTNNINILLVEDNPVNAKIATTVLQKHNFKVELTSNGQLAMDKIKTNHSQYQLILMDIHMPVMDGITCSKLIRKYEIEHGCKKVPIIALTADTSAGHKNICLEAGCNEFMPKPLDYPSLISLLKKLLDPSFS
eukprot:gene5330-6648_t